MKPRMTVAALGVAVLLTGCATSPGVQETPDPSPAKVAASAPSDAWPELPRGLLATGSFEGAAHGDVEILNLGDDMFTLRIHDFHIDLERYSGITAVAYPTFPAETCSSSKRKWSFGYAREGVVEEEYEVANPLYGFEGDPSLIRELIIQDLDAPNGLDECSAPPAAKAVLNWTYEPLRASLRAVDAGPTGGARGEPVLADGRVVGYVVAPNDLVDEVAARFGMTADDIRYLNPLGGPKLRVEETIVLDGAFR